MKNKLQKVCAKAITLMFLASITIFGFAFTAEAITAGPSSIEITANPGDVIKQNLTLTNNEDKSLYLTVEAKDYIISPTSNNRQYVDVAPPRGCKDWLKFDYNEQFANQNETKAFETTITIPSDAKPGTYYTAIFSSTKAPAEESAGSQIGIVGRVLIDVSITIAGDFNESAEITDFSLNEAQYKEGIIVFETEFKNTGDAVLAPTGSVKIFDEKNNQVKKVFPIKQTVYGQEVVTDEKDEIPFNQYLTTTLPESTKIYSVLFTGALQQGKYKAKLELFYGEEKAKLEAETQFEITKTFYISEFNTENYFYSSLPIKFNLKIKNSGTSPVQPSGKFEIYNIFGAQKKNVAFSSEEMTINGGEEKTIQNLVWDSGFAFGVYNAKATFEIGSQVYEKSITFWVINWWQTTIIIAVLLAIILSLYKMFAVYRKAKKQLEEKK